MLDARPAGQRPDLIVHCAAQPSHDLAKDRPFDDFDINAVGTLNLLEAARRALPGGAVHLHEHQQGVRRRARTSGRSSSSRRAGTTPTRPTTHGIDENCRVDACLHSLFGASKLAADLMVQEYGRYFGMPTVCFRGGCLTGPHHSGAELHGFLAYLARGVQEGRVYRIYGYKGKQVRDNIHAYDVCTASWRSSSAPRRAAVYNLGGGREQQRLGARGDRALRGARRPRLEDRVRRGEPRRRSHLLHQRPAPHPGRLPWMAPDGSLDDILRNWPGSASPR